MTYFVANFLNISQIDVYLELTTNKTSRFLCIFDASIFKGRAYPDNNILIFISKSSISLYLCWYFTFY